MLPISLLSEVHNGVLHISISGTKPSEDSVESGFACEYGYQIPNTKGSRAFFSASVSLLFFHICKKHSKFCHTQDANKDNLRIHTLLAETEEDSIELYREIELTNSVLNQLYKDFLQSIDRIEARLSDQPLVEIMSRVYEENPTLDLLSSFEPLLNMHDSLVFPQIFELSWNLYESHQKLLGHESKLKGLRDELHTANQQGFRFTTQDQLEQFVDFASTLHQVTEVDEFRKQIRSEFVHSSSLSASRRL